MSPRPRTLQIDAAESMWQVAASVLRQLRTAKQLSQGAVGKIIDKDRRSVARLEDGDVKMTLGYARMIDAAWGLDGLLSGIVDQAQRQHQGGWTKERRALQVSADQLLIWELAWVPGLMQTDDYARAMFTAGRYKDVEAALQRRANERAVLDTEVEIRCLLDQGVIEQPVGGADVMRGQLARLLELSDRHSIRIVARSVGAHVGRDGSWWVMSGPEGDTAYSEARGDGRLIREGAEVRWYQVWFDRVADLAMSRSESQSAIRQAMEGFTS